MISSRLFNCSTASAMAFAKRHGYADAANWTLFTRFHRVIRDITRANGKDIRLTIGGEKTELDKRMIDEFGRPDDPPDPQRRGPRIESPERRAAAGKPPKGRSRWTLHRGQPTSSSACRDDGQGLDADRLRAKAVEKRLYLRRRCRKR